MSITILSCIILQSIAISILLPKDLSTILKGVTSIVISGMLMSILFFVMLAVGVSDSLSLVLYFFIVFMLFAISTYLGKLSFKGLENKLNPENRGLRISYNDIIFLLLSLLSVAGYYYYSETWGGWDGWAIWNMHAKQILYSNLDFIGNQSLVWSHTDYPLGLPALIALLNGSHSLIPKIPLHLHAGIWILMHFTLYSFLRKTSISQITRWLILVFILLDPHILVKAASQMADVSLALCILLTWCLYFELQLIKSEKSQQFTYLWLGIVASFPMWIKNEGAIFFAFFSLFILIRFRSELKSVYYYILGTSPTLLIWVFFKFWFAPKNPLFELERVSLLLENLSDWSRWEYLISSIGTSIIQFYIPILIISFLLILRGRIQPYKHGLLVLGSTFIVYLLAYFVTPYGYQWHIDHSIDRLIFQLLPAFLILLVGAEKCSKIGHSLENH